MFTGSNKRQIFVGRVIFHGYDINWPSCSSDQTVPDYFLLGYLKEKVYVNKPLTLQQLKNNIRIEIEAIGSETLRNVMENEERACLFEAEKGYHLKN